MRTILPLLVLLSACASAPPPAPAAPPPPASAATPPAAPEAPATTSPSTTSATTPSATPASPAAPAASKIEIPANVRAVVEAADRADADKALDAGRHPAETLAFFGIAPSMKVGEIVSGTGYTAELLARAVGPTGVVYAENPKFILEKYAAKGWTERLAKPVNKNIKRVDREVDAPFPPDVKDLDAVVDVLFYHDTVWMKADRDKMNKAIFNALKSGGVYGIVDHSGRAGTGVTESQTLHRIDEKVVIDEITKAGFKLAAEADFLRNPDDKRDWNDAPFAAADQRGKSDRFVLKFVKP